MKGLDSVKECIFSYYRASNIRDIKENVETADAGRVHACKLSTT
jgi:hypothetical protein